MSRVHNLKAFCLAGGLRSDNLVWLRQHVEVLDSPQIHKQRLTKALRGIAREIDVDAIIREAKGTIDRFLRLAFGKRGHILDHPLITSTRFPGALTSVNGLAKHLHEMTDLEIYALAWLLQAHLSDGDPQRRPDRNVIAAAFLMIRDTSLSESHRKFPKRIFGERKGRPLTGYMKLAKETVKLWQRAAVPLVWSKKRPESLENLTRLLLNCLDPGISVGTRFDDKEKSCTRISVTDIYRGLVPYLPRALKEVMRK